MSQGVDPSPIALATKEASQSSIALFSAALRRSPFRTAFGLVVEYAMFASAVFLATSLFLTRVPLRAIDRALGWRLRERFIELIARISPG